MTKSRPAAGRWAVLGPPVPRPVHDPVVALYLVGQLFVQLFGNGVVELPLKLPRGDPHGVHHLHQDEHPGPRGGPGNGSVSQAPGVGRWALPNPLGPVPVAETPRSRQPRPAVGRRGRAPSNRCGARSASAKRGN